MKEIILSVDVTEHQSYRRSSLYTLLVAEMLSFFQMTLL